MTFIQTVTHSQRFKEDEVSRMTCQGNILASACWEAELQQQWQKPEHRAALPSLLLAGVGVGNSVGRKESRNLRPQW